MDEFGLAALLLMLLTPASAHASCCNDASRNQEHVQRHGSARHVDTAPPARAAWSASRKCSLRCQDKEQAMAWCMGSSGRAANMRLPGCKAVASAVGHDGTRYWAMVIGN